MAQRALGLAEFGSLRSSFGDRDLIVPRSAERDPAPDAFASVAIPSRTLHDEALCELKKKREAQLPKEPGLTFTSRLVQPAMRLTRSMHLLE
jgi:hypothetical protein